MLQKKVFALALAAGLVTPLAALADNGNFTFYGKADVSYDMVNTGDGTTTANGATAVTGVTKRVVSSNVSKFGFKGAEDLGDGLSAIWQVEQQINIDDAAKNTFASRNTFAGLKSESIGTLLFGIHDTPYKIATRKLDVFGDNIADNRALLGAPKAVTAVAPTATAGAAAFAGASNQGFELRPNNVLAYISPAFSGVTAAVATVNLTEQNYNNAHLANSALSLAVMYDAAPFYGSAAYESHKLETVAAGAKESATRLGFGFKPEAFEVNVVYEKTTDNLGAAQVNSLGHSAFYVGGKYNIGNDAVKLAYGKAGVLGTGAAQVVDSGASQISVGYDHGLSKRTKLYAVYSKITNGKGINYGFSQNSGAATTSSGFGTSPSALSLGVQHSF
ncbi:MAG: porin [Pseudomonadota bacterium]